MEYTNENQQTQENAPQEMKEEKITASRETAKDVIARLSKKKKAERTAEEEIELLEAKKKVHAATESAKIAKLKKKLEDAKRTAIIKNLDANNITTENEIKAVLSMRNILHESNITTPQVFTLTLVQQSIQQPRLQSRPFRMDYGLIPLRLISR